MQDILVYKHPEKYCSFPSVVRLQSNHLILVFRVAGKCSVEAAKSDQVTHHDPDSAIAMIESQDGGQTWPESSFRIVFSPPQGCGVNDPGLIVLSNGDLLLRVAVLNVVPSNWRKDIPGTLISHRPEHDLVASLKGNLLLKSTDLGRSWHELSFIEPEGFPRTCSRESVVELEDGSLLLSAYYGAPQKTDEALVFRSYDQGVSWGDVSVVAKDLNGTRGQHHGVNFNETAILNLGKGELLAMIRGDSSFFTEDGETIPVGGVGELMQTRSLDAGLSWFPPKPSGIWGQPAHLLRLRDDRIVCTYGYRKQPCGICEVVSKDQGRTWTEPVFIREHGASWDMGYPCSVELDDDRIFTAYYFHEEDGVRHIAGTIWSPS